MEDEIQLIEQRKDKYKVTIEPVGFLYLFASVVQVFDISFGFNL